MAPGDKIAGLTSPLQTPAPLSAVDKNSLYPGGIIANLDLVYVAKGGPIGRRRRKETGVVYLIWGISRFPIPNLLDKLTCYFFPE